MSPRRCGDCHCEEGALHSPGCDMEICPKCGRQLISCDCAYDFLFQDRDRTAHFEGLPEHIYKNGLPPVLEAKWEAELNRVGRIPYIQYPLLCARCGQHWPDLFMVPDEEWRKYVDPRHRRDILCLDCYHNIRRLIDSHRA